MEHRRLRNAASAIRHVCDIDHGVAHRFVNLARKLEKLEVTTRSHPRIRGCTLIRMTPRPVYGIVAAEKPRVLHRFGNVAGRSCCGKHIVPIPDRDRSHAVACGRCSVLDKARREGMPDWF